MNLSKRLQAIANFVKKDSRVCDIGTDHGYIPVYLIEECISKKVIGTDISKGSLEKIIDLIEREKLNKSIDARLGDGLNILDPYEVDTLIIAGMGGVLIAEILEDGKEKLDGIDNYILQPMTASKELRKYLSKNNFKIIDEDLVFEEGKYYEIINAKRGQEIIKQDIYYEISKILIEKSHPLLKSFVEDKRDKIEIIMDKIKSVDTKKSRIKYKKSQELLQEYQEVLKTIES